MIQIVKRHEREFAVGMNPSTRVCREECDGFRCTLEQNHDGDEHIATGPWHARGSEVYKRWPVVRERDGAL